MNEREIDEALEPLRELLKRRETLGFERKVEFTTKQNNKTEVNLMASFDFESLKQKITDTAGMVKDKTVDLAKTVAGKSSEAARNVAGKAQDMAKKARLNAEIASERDGMKKKYLELGKLYYEKYSADPDPDFSEPVTAITQALERVAAKQAEIDALEEEAGTEEAGTEEAETGETETDHIVDEVEDTVEAAADQAADVAEEAAEEARKVYEDVVDTVGKTQEE